MLAFLDPRVWLAIAIASAAGYVSGRWQQYQADEKATAAVRVKETETALSQEREWRRLVKGTTDARDMEVRAIRRRLDDAIERLRQRPERLPEAARPACEGSTGVELSGRDAAFLERLAARADEIRSELKACQDREHGGNQ
jgi:hypothetical protein